MKEIHYTIFALRKDEIEEVLEKIANHDQLKNWLSENKDSIYGNTIKEWKPFENKTIEQLLADCNNGLYDFFPETDFMEEDIHENKIEGIASARINVIFIDPFTIFLDKYRDLILEISSNIFEGEKRVGCFIFFDTNCNCIHDDCFKTWKNILEYFESGKNHCIAYNKSLLRNFINKSDLPFNPPRMHEKNKDKDSLESEYKSLPSFK